MANFKLKKLGGSGWFLDPMRHSNARKFGRAGGSYSNHNKLLNDTSSNKVDITDRYMRHRILSPNLFEKGSFRTIDTGRPNNTKVIVATNKYNKQQMVQSILVSKDSSTSTHLAAEKEAQKLRNRALKDSDNDGLPNAVDCAPKDPNKHGLISLLLKKNKSKQQQQPQESLQTQYRGRGMFGRPETHKAAAKGIKIKKLIAEQEEDKRRMQLELQQPQPQHSLIDRFRVRMIQRSNLIKAEKAALKLAKSKQAYREEGRLIASKTRRKYAYKHKRFGDPDTVSGDIMSGLEKLRAD